MQTEVVKGLEKTLDNISKDVKKQSNIDLVRDWFDFEGHPGCPGGRVFYLREKGLMNWLRQKFGGYGLIQVIPRFFRPDIPIEVFYDPKYEKVTKKHLDAFRVQYKTKDVDYLDITEVCSNI